MAIYSGVLRRIALTPVFVRGMAVLTAVLLGLITGRVANAASLVVTSLADADDSVCDANCTLREAINKANADAGADTISFNINGTITLASALPHIDDEVTISGAGHAITVSGNSLYQVLYVNAGKTLYLNTITIAYGIAGFGGGVHNKGTLDVTSSTFFSNTATDVGGAIYNSAVLSLTNSVLLSNTGYTGGGLYNDFGTSYILSSTLIGNTSNWDGGGIYSTGPLRLISSTLSSNAAGTNGGAVYNDAVLDIVNSTLSGNTALPVGFGAGIYNYNNYYGLLTIMNSTIAGNTGGYGGGIYSYIAMTLTNSTVSGNSATQQNSGIYSWYTLHMLNSISANNAAGDDCFADSERASATGSNNLFEGTSCGVTNGVNGNIVGVDPKLGPLENNGGTTLTLRPMGGSPAIDAGTNVGCPATDQRGVSRPKGARCDIGAVESLIYPVQYLPISFQ